MPLFQIQKGTLVRVTQTNFAKEKSVDDFAPFPLR